MAISRIKVWIAGEVLTASDLNNEFNNIIDNLSFSLSGDIGNGTLTVPGLKFANDTNTGIYLAGVDQIALVAGGATAFVVTRVSAGTAFALFSRGVTDSTRVYPALTFGGPNDGIAALSAGTLDFITAGVRAAQASAYANATNYLVFTPGQAGTPAILETAGGDTNVPMLLRGKGTGYVTASRFVFESFVATQSPVQAGRAYWNTVESSLHIDAGTLIARVPAIQGLTTGDLIQAVHDGGATSYARFPASGEASLLRVKNAAPVYMAVGSASQYLMVATVGGDLVYGSTRGRIPFADAGTMSTSPRYAGPWASSASEADSYAHHLITHYGRISNLYVHVNAAPGVNNDVKITVRVNGASAFSTLTISGTATSGSLTSESFPVKPGDYVTFQHVLSTAASTTLMGGALELDSP